MDARKALRTSTCTTTAACLRLPTVVFRMSCIAGPQQFGNEDQGWVAHFLYSALENKPLTIYGDGRQVRDVLSVKDLVLAFEKVRAQVEKTAGQIYNVGGGIKNSVSLLEVIEIIEQITGKRLRYSLQRPRPGDQLFYVTDFDKLTKHTGWKPKISVSQNIEMIWNWWKEQRVQTEVISISRDPQPVARADSGGCIVKFALVNPAWTFEGSTYFGCQEPHYPLELLFASDQIREAGHEPLLIDAQLQRLSTREVKSAAG